MSNDPSPLKSMGTQSQETMNMAAAKAQNAARASERAVGEVVDALADGADAAGRVLPETTSVVGDAAHWAMDKAKDVIESAAIQARARATTAVESYTRADPIRAILISAGVGALLMGLLGMMARSGVRTVRRGVRRTTGADV